MRFYKTDAITTQIIPKFEKYSYCFRLMFDQIDTSNLDKRTKEIMKDQDILLLNLLKHPLVELDFIQYNF